MTLRNDYLEDRRKEGIDMLKKLVSAALLCAGCVLVMTACGGTDVAAPSTNPSDGVSNIQATVPTLTDAVSPEQPAPPIAESGSPQSEPVNHTPTINDARPPSPLATGIRVIFATNDETSEEGRAAAIEAMRMRLVHNGLGGAEYSHMYWIRHDELVVEFGATDDAELLIAFLGADEHPHLTPLMVLPYSFFNIYMNIFVEEAMEASVATTDRPVVLDEPAAPPVVLSPGGYALPETRPSGRVSSIPAIGFGHEVVIDVQNSPVDRSSVSGGQLEDVAEEVREILERMSEVAYNRVDVVDGRLVIEFDAMAMWEVVFGYIQYNVQSYHLSVVTSARLEHLEHLP